MKLRIPRIGAPALPARRRRTPRPDAPRTILPGDVPPGADRPATEPDGDLLGRLDAARERLRARIPPLADD